MGYIVDQVSTHERALNVVTTAHSEWIHFWTSWEPPVAALGKNNQAEEAVQEFDPDSAIMGPQIKFAMKKYHSMATNLANQLKQSQQNLWKAQQKVSFDKGKGKGEGKLKGEEMVERTYSDYNGCVPSNC